MSKTFTSSHTFPTCLLPNRLSPKKYHALLISSALALSACGNDAVTLATSSPPLPAWITATQLGGDTTDTSVSRGSSQAFGAPALNLSDEQLALHLQGDAGFEQTFVALPSISTPQFDGVGPVHNNINCAACHQHNGRGTPVAFADEWTILSNNESLLLGISIENHSIENDSIENGSACQPDSTNHFCAPLAVPGFSTQLFQRGLALVRPDSPGSGQADVYARYRTSMVRFADGETVTLRQPEFNLRNPYDHPGEQSGDNTPAISRLLQDDVKTSPRIGMPVFGLGLLEAIKASDILALADANDADGDGISGRANFVLDIVKQQNNDPNPVSLGRFGWKANSPSLLVQTLSALRNDMGVTNFLLPEPSILNTPLYEAYLLRNPQDIGIDSNGNPEADDDFAKSLVFYMQTLHVPARRNSTDANVIKGAQLFADLGCTACHHPSYTTGESIIPALSNQTIYPFSDMLLHDMGEGLADGRRDFLASGREWKTRPLWGIGLTQVVNPSAGFLHDGRAKTLTEAILWHGGEAETTKEKFRQLSQPDRLSLIGFLQSL